MVFPGEASDSKKHFRIKKVQSCFSLRYLQWNVFPNYIKERVRTWEFTINGVSNHVWSTERAARVDRGSHSFRLTRCRWVTQVWPLDSFLKWWRWEYVIVSTQELKWCEIMAALNVRKGCSHSYLCGFKFLIKNTRSLDKITLSHFLSLLFSLLSVYLLPSFCPYLPLHYILF